MALNIIISAKEELISQNPVQYFLVREKSDFKCSWA
jgi:hypothetical protein